MKHIRLLILFMSFMLLFGACSPTKPPSEQDPPDEPDPPIEQDPPTNDDLTLYPAAPPREEGERITWYSADLKETMRLAAEYVEGMLDADKNHEPYFYISAGGYGSPAVALHALEIGIPHVTGRAIDCLFNVERATGRPIDSFAEQVYTEYYYSCMEEIGLPVWYDESNNRQGMEAHNLRESCEGLAWLIRSRDDSTAYALADRFLTVLESLMPNGCGYISSSAIAKEGLSGWFSGDRNAPGDTGRLVGALLNLYDASGDERALTLAGDIAKNATRWFDPESGSMANAGTHIHSITSTLSGLLEYGYLAEDQDIIDLVRAVYEGENGLPLVMSSTGWIKEQINVANEVQGEVNQIGDVIEVQLLFAKNEKGERADWYAQAESFMRSALLPSQVLDNTFFQTAENPESDAYANIAERAIGGFGFPMPTAHLQGRASPINTIDITQGAVQAISYFTNHIAYVEDDVLWVNLLFDWENNVAKVESRLPLLGKVQITPKRDGTVHIRAYDGVDADSIRVYLNGKATDYTMENGYVVVENVRSGDAVYLDFDIASESYDETFYRGTPQECVYTIYKYGEQVVAVTPVLGVYPLYEGWPQEIEGLDANETVIETLTDEMKQRGYRSFVSLDAYSPDIHARGALCEYVTDEVRGKCLSYTQPNNAPGQHGILLDLFFEAVPLDPALDHLAFWLYVDDPSNTTALTVEYASYAIHAGEEMFQAVIDLAAYAANGSLKAGWNPIVIPLDLQEMDFSIIVNANNAPNYDNIFRIRFMNSQSSNGRAVNYKLDNVAFVRGDALKDYQFEDGSTALKDPEPTPPSGSNTLPYFSLDAASPDVAVGGASPAYVNDDERGACLSYSASNATGDLFVLTDFTFDPVSLDASTDHLAFWLYISDPSAVGTLVVEYASFRINAGEEMAQYTLDLAAAVANGQLHAGWNAIVMPLDLQGFALPYVRNAYNNPNMDAIMRIRLMNGQNSSGKPLTYKIDDLAFVRGEDLAD